jgi:hypothetical protein
MQNIYNYIPIANAFLGYGFEAGLYLQLMLNVLLLLLLLFVITFIQGIYNYISETNHVSRVINVAALL